MSQEHEQTIGKPDGYYLISVKDGQDPPCLCYLYDHPDFDGARHIAYGAQHGGGIIPVWDLLETVVLTPVKIVPVLDDPSAFDGAMKRVAEALAYAIAEADGWHDDARGGPIDTPEMDKARAVLLEINSSPYAVDEVFLTELKKYIEESEVCIEGEFGAGGTADMIFARGRMPPVYTEVLRRLGRTEP